MFYNVLTVFDISNTKEIEHNGPRTKSTVYPPNYIHVKK